MAISLASAGFPHVLENAKNMALRLADYLLGHPLPEGTYLNVNLPAQETDRFRITRQGNPLCTGGVVVDSDPRGKRYYWIAERPPENHPPPDTDRGAIEAGFASISLLTLDRNFHGSWPNIDLEGFRKEPS
jgi:5'-nucleotidase